MLRNLLKIHNFGVMLEHSRNNCNTFWERATALLPFRAGMPNITVQAPRYSPNKATWGACSEDLGGGGHPLTELEGGPPDGSVRGSA